MIREKITLREGTAALPLSKEILEAAGFQVGDDIDIDVTDGAILLRPAQEAGREQKLESVIDDLLARRRDAYQRLA